MTYETYGKIEGNLCDKTSCRDNKKKICRLSKNFEIDDCFEMGYDLVKVGSGTKVHLKSRGSSVTQCGYWAGKHPIYLVEYEEGSLCEKCDNTNIGFWLEKIRNSWR